MPKLIVTEGPNTGAEFNVGKAVILGRLETNDVPIQDGKASREHAKIFQQGSDYAIVDLNSSNGTFVNGQKITKRVLKPGDEIAIGLVQLRFDLAMDEKKRADAPKRKSLDEAFESGAKPKDAPGGAGAATPSGAPGDVKFRNHQPLQFRKVKPGRSLLGFDLSQMGDDAKLILTLILIGFLALCIYLGFQVTGK
ncbi:MAG: FHA domain-containing protein [Planctomycetaceae bacterium]